MNGEMILALTAGAAMAGVLGYVAQDVYNRYQIMKEEMREEEKGVAVTYLREEDLWFNVGEEVIYNNTPAIIIGNGLNNLVTILIEDTVIDVSVNKLRKVVII